MDDAKLFIGVEQEGFFKSTDGGRSWRRASEGIKAWERTDGAGLCYEEFYATIIDPRDPRRLCLSMAGGPGTINSPTSAGNNGVYCSQDAGETWRQMATPTMNTAVYSLAADPRNFDVIYAAVNGGPCSNPPPVCAPGTYFNTKGAIYKTTNGGESWTELDALYVPDLRVNVLRIDQRDPDVIIAATFSKLPPASAGSGAFHETPQLGVLRSTDAGANWVASKNGMSDDPGEQALLGMDIASQNGSRLYAIASSNAGYWSDDGGRSFHKASRLDTIAFDPHDPAGLRLLGASDSEVRESQDGGATWTRKSTLPTAFSRQFGLPTKIAWSPTNPRRVFMAGPRANIFRSDDGGSTWTQILSAERLPK